MKNQILDFSALKDDNIKSFRIKKLFNELPTMNNLKKRNPKLYKKDYKCPRCNQNEETLTHLWECEKAANDMVILRLKAKKNLFKLIKNSNKFNNVDNLLDELFPFCKTKKQLKRHDKFNSDYYKNFEDKKFKLEYTYIWNGLDFFDNILKGWIPIRLINLLRKYLKRDSKTFIKNLLVKWLGKIDTMFFEKIWKPRNEDMLRWENTNNISKLQKRKRLSKSREKSKGEIRKANKITFSGKKRSSVHIFDENLDFKIREILGLNRMDFQRVTDKKILIKFKLDIENGANLLSW